MKRLIAAIIFLFSLGVCFGQNPTLVYTTNGAVNVPSTTHAGKVTVGLSTNGYSGSVTQYYGHVLGTYQLITPSSTSTSPGGSSTDIQFNNSGSFGGSNAFRVTFSGNDTTIKNVAPGKMIILGNGISIGTNGIDAATYDTVIGATNRGVSAWVDGGKGLLTITGNQAGNVKIKGLRAGDGSGYEITYDGDTDNITYFSNLQGAMKIGAVSGSTVDLGIGSSAGFTPTMTVRGSSVDGKANSITNFVNAVDGTVWHMHTESIVTVGNSLTRRFTANAFWGVDAFQDPPNSGDSFYFYTHYIKAGTYTFAVYGATDGNYGQQKYDFVWQGDGTTNATAAGFDWYSAGTTLNVRKTATVVLTKDGVYKVIGTTTNKNGSSSSFYFDGMAFFLGR